MENIKSNKNRNIILIAAINLILFLITIFLIFGPFEWFKNIEKYFLRQNQLIFGFPKMNFNSNLFNAFMTFCAKYGDVIPIIVLVLVIMVVLFLKKQYFTSLWLGITIGSGGLIGIIMKLIFKRQRPIGHLAIDNGYSFPSGHSLGSTIFLGALLFLIEINVKKNIVKRTLQFMLIIFWLGILFSRIYFNAHYLGDVIGGVTFGVFWLFSFIYLYIKYARVMKNNSN